MRNVVARASADVEGKRKEIIHVVRPKVAAIIIVCFYYSAEWYLLLLFIV